ncbi:hypothetical protein LAZ67_20001048 [Cordylochernes scorpioides]|uniref:Reverse transcriptase domain-containing protein n=1 Tax=Cordylochernes scorpioides TaxID=51811 RepID=A0ABY6LLY6_9ARAC|nr:hypothetical protein LAZ67_20001048 [Cordylochernes scorpioides]
MKTARPAPTNPTEDRPECQETTDKMHPRTSPYPGTNKKLHPLVQPCDFQAPTQQYLHNNQDQFWSRGIQDDKATREDYDQIARRASRKFVKARIQESHRMVDIQKQYLQKIRLPRTPYTKKELRTLCRNKLITTEELRNFLSNLHGQAYIYGLPKVHKINIPLRPIVAFHLSPTAPLAQFLAKIIIPILKDGDVSTSISSTPKFLNHIQHLPVIPNSLMISFDVINLYPSLPHPLIIECITEFLRTHGYSADMITKLTSLISICLNNSIFNFDKRYYRQSKGTPMGSPLSSPLSEIVMRKIDNSITDHFPVDILIWFRYIDDIFCIVKTDSLDKIHAKLNSLYPDILFTVQRIGQRSTWKFIEKDVNWEKFTEEISFQNVHNLSNEINQASNTMDVDRIVMRLTDIIRNQTLYTISCIESALQHQSHTDKFCIRSFVANTLQPTPRKSSLSLRCNNQDITALKSLKAQHDILITKSDKGSQVVVLKAQDYKQKMTDILSDPNTFHKISPNQVKDIANSYKTALRSLRRTKGITSDQFLTFTSNISGVPYIYGLPKTHKPDIPLRPIVAYHLSPAFPLAKYLCTLLKPLVSSHTTFTRPKIPLTLSPDFFNICLALNTLFHGSFFIQTRGSPMGSPLSTVAAEIVMSNLDRWLSSQNYLGIELWSRYVDDIFCLHRNTDHLPILNALNSYNPDLRFTHNPSRFNCILFLDVLIVNTEHTFHTTVYRKPNSAPSYLHFKSHAPISHKITTVKTISKKIYTHCSLDCFKKNEKRIVYNHLSSAGYPHDFIRHHFYSPNSTKTVPPPYKDLCVLPFSARNSDISFFYANSEYVSILIIPLPSILPYAI